MVNLAEFTIEIVYANSHKQKMVTIKATAGTTVLAAIIQSNILENFPDIDLTQNKVGIFNKIVTLDTGVQEGDRVEIYCPLLIDPKVVRKKRAKQQKNSIS